MKDLSPPSIVLSGVGSYAPPRILTNDDLSKIVDTTDEWIRTRTGILERRIADEEETCSDMAAKAAKAAIEDAGLQPSDIGCIIVATITPDMPFPSTACLVGDKLGLPGVPAFDVEAACSGFIYIMEIARAMIAAGTCKHAVIIGAEKLSSIVDSVMARGQLSYPAATNPTPALWARSSELMARKANSFSCPEEAAPAPPPTKVSKPARTT